MKKIITCIGTLVLFLLILQTNSFAATEFIGMNGQEWNNYLKGLSDRLINSQNKILTYDEYYMVERARCDFEHKFYYTNEKIKGYSSKLEEMDSEYDSNGNPKYTIRQYYDNIIAENGKKFEMAKTIEKPDYTEITPKKIFESVKDKRYWAKVLIEAHEKDILNKEYTQKEREDLRILFQLKQMQYDFPSVSKIDGAIYTQYYTKELYENIPRTEIFEFDSFDAYINNVKFFKDKKNLDPNSDVENPGGTTNPGGETNPGGGSTGGKPVNDVTLGDIVSDADDFLGSANHDPIKNSNLEKMSDNIYNILFFVGLFAAVIVGGILGIKFMIEGAEGKAEVKTMLVPYVIGCIVLFGAFTIWKVLLVILQS